MTKTSETPAPYTPSRTTLPRSVILLSWVSFFADVSGEMIYPLLPLFLVGALNASRTELGLIEGTATLVVALLAAYAGIRSDRSRRRVPWIRSGYGLPVVGKAVIAIAGNWWVVLAGRLIDRTGKGFRGAPRDALIAGAVGEKDRGRAFGYHRAFDTAGALVGVVLSAVLIAWLTGTPRASDAAGAAGSAPVTAYRIIFGIGALLGLASLALTFFVRERETTPGETASNRKIQRSSEADSAAESGGVLPPSYWTALAALIVFSLANSSDTFLLLRIQDLGYSPWAVVVAYALYNLVYAALSYPAGVLSDRWGRWRVLGAGWMIYFLVYAGLAALPAAMAWGAWPLMACYGAYMALTDGVGKALIADHSPKALRGRAMGLYYCLSGVTTLMASLLVGLLWDRHGAPAALMTGAGISAAAFLLVVIQLVNSKRSTR